jgi:DUF1680 family protein
MRLVASLGHYAATQDAGGLQIHQYGAARIAADLASVGSVVLRIESDYPWDGQMRIVVEEGGSAPWTLSLRIPGWAGDAAIHVNGQDVDTFVVERGYVQIGRAWASGDVVELDLLMEPRLTEAHPWIESTRGCVAIERGPLVYCLEQHDQQAPVYDLELDPSAPLTASWQPELLDGVSVVRGSGYRIDRSGWEGLLYRRHGATDAPKQPVELAAIPVYAWANRGPAAMKIWVPLG